MSVILAIWGVLKLGGLLFQARLGKKFVTPHLDQQLGMVTYACDPKVCGRLRLGGPWFQTSPGNKVCNTPSQWIKAGCAGSRLLSQLQQEA
jgi:hypothetical protein